MSEEVPGPDRAEVSATIARMRAGFRNCFNAELARNPKRDHVTMHVPVRIGPKGEVLEDPRPAADPLEACIRAEIHRHLFPPPPDGTVTIAIPLVFTKP